VDIMQQAVLEFDEAVQVPWRPSFGSTSTPPPRPRSRPALTVVRGGAGRPSGAGGGKQQGHDGSAAANRPGAGGAPARPGSGRGAPDRLSPNRRPVHPRAADAPVRLTRRGRRLLVAVCLAVGLVLGALVTPLLGGSSGDLRLAGQSRVVVRSGDTLWSIAASVAGDDDVRVVVDRIEQLNGLHGAAVRPGQLLLLP
jgi:nucleoid-associated protein YgaU